MTMAHLVIGVGGAISAVPIITGMVILIIPPSSPICVHMYVCREWAPLGVQRGFWSRGFGGGGEEHHVSSSSWIRDGRVGGPVWKKRLGTYRSWSVGFASFPKVVRCVTIIGRAGVGGDKGWGWGGGETVVRQAAKLHHLTIHKVGDKSGRNRAHPKVYNMPSGLGTMEGKRQKVSMVWG